MVCSHAVTNITIFKCDLTCTTALLMEQFCKHGKYQSHDSHSKADFEDYALFCHKLASIKLVLHSYPLCLAFHQKGKSIIAYWLSLYIDLAYMVRSLIMAFLCYSEMA